LSRGASLLAQLDANTRDGFVLAPETVAAIGRAEARRNRGTAAALWAIALLLGTRLDLRGWPESETIARIPLAVRVPGGGIAVLFRYGVVVFFDVTDAEILARLTRRRGVEQRADDDPAAVATRLENYRRQTAPVLEWYQARGGVDRIPSVGTVQEVAERVRQVLGR